MVPTLPSVHQDIRIVSSNEVGVRPYRIGEGSCDAPHLVVNLRTLQSEFAPVLRREVSGQLDDKVGSCLFTCPRTLITKSLS